MSTPQGVKKVEIGIKTLISNAKRLEIEAAVFCPGVKPDIVDIRLAAEDALERLRNNDDAVSASTG